MLASALVFEARRMSRNFPPLFFGLGFPIMMLAIFGGIYGNKPNPQFGGLGTVDISLPAYVALVLAVAGLMSFPLGMVEHRSRGFLRLLRTTPARPNAFLAAQVVVNGAVCLVGIALLVGVGMTVYSLDAPRHPVAFVAIALLAAGSTFGLGTVIAAVANSETAAAVVANIVFFPMIFLSGATVPLEIMPAGMRHISDALPLSYAVAALKWAWLDKQGSDLPLSLGVLAATLVVCAVASVKLFRWE
jgi:ABC-2 type transport system permease protein